MEYRYRMAMGRGRSRDKLSFLACSRTFGEDGRNGDYSVFHEHVAVLDHGQHHPKAYRGEVVWPITGALVHLEVF